MPENNNSMPLRRQTQTSGNELVSQMILEFEPSSSPPHITLAEELKDDQGLESEIDVEEREEDVTDHPISNQTAERYEGRGFCKSEDIERMAKDLVRMALVSAVKRQLLRQDEIKKALGDRRRLFPDVFSRAQEYLKAIFAMELVQTTLRERYSSTNMLSRQGGVLLKDQLYSYLEKLGFDSKASYEPHGSLENILLLLVRQAYLDRTKVPVQETGQEIYRYKWGPRSKSEFTDENLILFVKRIYDFQDASQAARLETELRRTIGFEP